MRRVRLYGFVGDTAGNPVEGVVVSDGFQCVATDAGGVYQMKRNDKAEYVYYSVPAEFKIRTGHDGYPDFYVRLDASQQKTRQGFHARTPRGRRAQLPLICIGDPQPAKAEEAARFERETMVDVRRTATASAVPPATAWRWATSRARSPTCSRACAVRWGRRAFRSSRCRATTTNTRWTTPRRATPPISAIRWGRWTTRSTAATCTWSAWTT